MRRLLLLAMVGVLIVAVSACDTSQMGQQVESVSYRYYNNAQYGTIAVHDGIAPGAVCAVGLTASGLGVVAAVAAWPEDTPLLALSWGTAAWGLGTSLGTCWDTFEQTVQMDAFSRILLSCSDDQGQLSPLFISLGYCSSMGWMTNAVNSTLAIVDNVAKGITSCREYGYDPLHGSRICTQY